VLALGLPLNSTMEGSE